MRGIQVEEIIGQYKEKIQLGFVAQISSFKSVFEPKKCLTIPIQHCT